MTVDDELIPMYSFSGVDNSVETDEDLADGYTTLIHIKSEQRHTILPR